MAADPANIIAVSRTVRASPERAFDAWLDPAMVWTWLREAAKLQPERGRAIRVEIDPRVGGAFTFVDEREHGEVLHTGEYLEIDRPRELAFTWSIPAYSPRADVIRVHVEPGDGGARMTLTTEVQPEWVDYAERVREGWTVTLDAIAGALA